MQRRPGARMPSLTAVAQTEKMPATDSGSGIFLHVQVLS
jgi:hypothetical protein